jgi:hypothetical protein
MALAEIPAPNQIPTIDAKSVNRKNFTKTPQVTVRNTHGIAFTIYSFGNRPAQNVQHLPSDQYANSADAYCPLPMPCHTATGATGTVIVGIGAAGFSHHRLVSTSFASCTPIAAFYRDGKIALYHANSAPERDVRRQQLLSAGPTDIFVVTRPGEGHQMLAQSAQALDIIQHAPRLCNVHIVEVPRQLLAIEVTPGRLAIYQMALFGRAHRPA